jgi:hypothetical protein
MEEKAVMWARWRPKIKVLCLKRKEEPEEMLRSRRGNGSSYGW